MRTLSLCMILFGLNFVSVWAQDVTVTAKATPDDTMSPAYMALDDHCRALVTRRDDPAEAVEACKRIADEADKFAPETHFITRRAAYVFYMSALIQAKRYKEAIAVGDKAVAVVLQGHDDDSGASAAYGRRGQAKAFAGNLSGAIPDIERAEQYERNGLASPAGKALHTEYTRTLQGLLTMHGQALEGLGQHAAAEAKLNEAKQLQ